MSKFYEDMSGYLPSDSDDETTSQPDEQSSTVKETKITIVKTTTKPAASARRTAEPLKKPLINYAKQYDSMGFVVLPCKKGAKSPACKTWATTKKSMLDFPAGTVGLGILTGSRSGVTVVDIDDIAFWNRIRNIISSGEFEELESMPHVATPSGGLHYYFEYDEEIKGGTNCIDVVGLNGRSDAKSGVDVRNDGGFIVAAPSEYATDKEDKKKYLGLRYKWIVDLDDAPLQPCPEWLKRLICKEDVVQEADGTYSIVCAADVSGATRSQSLEIDNDPAPPVAGKLTFEQVRDIVNGLNTGRFADYNNWAHMLWAVARWQDENSYDEEETLDMLDEFCQTCPGYGSRRDVEKKYNEAFKANGRASVVTVGTLIMWLKEDNFVEYCRLFRAKVEAVPQKITRADPYCYADFCTELESKIWPNFSEMAAYIGQNINRVLALIQKEKGYYIKKDSCTGSMFGYVEQIKGPINPQIKYASVKLDMRCKPPKETQLINTTDLAEFIKNNSILKRYHDVGCYPDEANCPATIYNIWEGFQARTVETVDMDLIEPVLYILRDLWASSDENLFKYLLSWLRFTVAEPAEMTKTALFLYSLDGAGKGAFVDFFTQWVLGLGISHAYTGIEEVVEKHNTNKKGKKLAYVNEMGSTRDQFISNFDKIKPIITDSIIAENPKGRAIMQVKNITNVIMATNHKDSIYITANDRRYTCIEVSPARVGAEHKKWWGETFKKMMCQDVGNHFFTFLLKLDPADLPDPRQVFETKLRKEIIEISKDNVLRFIDYFIEDNNAAEEADRVESISANDLYSQYCSWCGRSGENAKSTVKFSMIVSDKWTKYRTSACIMFRVPQPADEE